MRNTARRTEPVVLAVAATALIGFAGSEILPRVLEKAGAGSYWMERRDTIGNLMIACGVVVLLGSLLSFYLGRKGGSIAEKLIEFWGEAVLLIKNDMIPALRESLKNREAIVFLTAATVIGVIVRGWFMRQPMRFDEAMSYLDFARGDLWRLFYYPFPNNQVLHSALMKLTTAIAGNSPVAIRLPAFIFGILIIPAGFFACRLLNHGRGGYLTACGMAAAPNLILYSTNARGYTIYCLIFLLMTLTAIMAAKKPNGGGALILALLAGLGMINMPVMLYPLAGLGVFLFAIGLTGDRNNDEIAKRLILPALILTGLITFIFYIPVIVVNDGVWNIIANNNVKAQPWGTFVGEIIPHVKASLRYLPRGLPVPVMIALGLLAVAGYGDALMRRDREAMVLLPALVGGAAVVFFVKQRIPFLRVWIYFIPIIFLYADTGLVNILRIIPRPACRVVNITVLIGTVLFAFGLMRSNAVANYPDTGIFPEAEKVVLKIGERFQNGDVIHAEVPAHFPLYYYLDRENMEFEITRGANTHTEFYVVQKSEYDLQRLTREPAKLWWEEGNAAIYTIGRQQD